MKKQGGWQRGEAWERSTRRANVGREFFEVLVLFWRSGGVFEETTTRGLKPLFAFSHA
jgi:hypothetical protein